MCVSGIECSIPQVACLKPTGGKRIVEGGWPPKKSSHPNEFRKFYHDYSVFRVLYQYPMMYDLLQ